MSSSTTTRPNAVWRHRLGTPQRGFSSTRNRMPAGSRICMKAPAAILRDPAATRDLRAAPDHSPIPTNAAAGGRT